MLRVDAFAQIAGVVLLAAGVVPAHANEVVDGVAGELARIVATDATLSQPYFTAVAPLGFTERADYDAEFSPQIPARSAKRLTAQLLPFALVLDAALGSASAHALDSINDAQGDTGGAAVYFEQGPVFLSDIAAAINDLALPANVADTPTQVTLSKPLVLSSRAVLVLQPGEQLTLDRAAGAFVIAAGGMVVDGAAVVGSEPPNPNEANFRPFILADATTGPVEISGAHFQHLGFGQDPRSAGVSISGGNLTTDRRSFVQDSSFIDMGSLSLVDATDSTIRRNVFERAFINAISIVASTSVIVDGNAVIQAGSGHGVKIGPGVSDVLVSDNIMAGSAKHGLMIEGDNTGTVVFNNLLFQNRASGMAIVDGACLSLEQNITLANGADGIMVRRSSGLSIQANLIEGNLRAGVSIGGDTGNIALLDNRFEDNKVGLRASASYELALNNNDWAGQTPRLLDGDIAQYTLPLLDGIKDGNTQLTMAGVPLPAARVAAFSSCKIGEAI